MKRKPNCLGSASPSMQELPTKPERSGHQGVGPGWQGCHSRAVTVGLAVSLGCPIPSCSPQHQVGKGFPGPFLNLLGMCLGVKDPGHGTCSIPTHGVSQGRGGTGQVRGASAAPSLPATRWANKDVTSPLPFCQLPPPARSANARPAPHGALVGSRALLPFQEPPLPSLWSLNPTIP